MKTKYSKADEIRQTIMMKGKQENKNKAKGNYDNYLMCWQQTQMCSYHQNQIPLIVFIEFVFYAKSYKKCFFI